MAYAPLVTSQTGWIKSVNLPEVDEMTRIAPVFVLCVSLLSTGRQNEDVTALRFGRLWDGERVIQNAFVVVTGPRITAVGSASDVPKGVKVLDFSRYTAIPGLIDLHTHVTYHWDRAPGTTPLKQGQQRTPVETARA